jgi:hypothetical protein
MIRRSLATAMTIAAIGYMHLSAPSARQDSAAQDKVPEFDVRTACRGAEADARYSSPGCHALQRKERWVRYSAAAFLLASIVSAS